MLITSFQTLRLAKPLPTPKLSLTALMRPPRTATSNFTLVPGYVGEGGLVLLLAREQQLEKLHK